MKKIYMVIADNGQDYDMHDWWIVKVFISKESAQVFIKTFTEEIKAAICRCEELEELMDARGLTDVEKEEYERVAKLDTGYWHFFDKGGFVIREYELHE